jgi:probable rRNA maturation factor
LSGEIDAGSIENEPEIGVTIVDDNTILELNREYREKDSVTDVLSFPQFEGHDDLLADLRNDEASTLIGDVVICYEQAERQADEYDTGITREILYLFVHSVMHLFGYDHMEEDEKAVMRKREEEVLAAIGVVRGK